MFLNDPINLLQTQLITYVILTVDSHTIKEYIAGEPLCFRHKETYDICYFIQVAK